MSVLYKHPLSRDSRHGRFFLGTWNMKGFLSEERPIRTLREVLQRLRESYCGTIGYEARSACCRWALSSRHVRRCSRVKTPAAENASVLAQFMHIPDRDRCNWLRERIETPEQVCPVLCMQPASCPDVLHPGAKLQGAWQTWLACIPQFTYSPERKIHILDRLAWSEMFESFLANKFAAAKRFGLEVSYFALFWGLPCVLHGHP